MPLFPSKVVLTWSESIAAHWEQLEVLPRMSHIQRMGQPPPIFKKNLRFVFKAASWEWSSCLCHAKPKGWLSNVLSLLPSEP